MPGGIDIGGLITGFDKARGEFAKAEEARAVADQQREFSILEALAKHIDPDLAALGAAGMLELAKGGPKRSKGIKGFLGEMDRSSYLPMIRDAFAKSAPAAPPPAGGAALPKSPIAGAPTEAPGPPSGQPPGMPTAAGEMGLADEDVTGGAGELPQPMQMAGPMPPPPPPAPETPQQKTRRLYPTAGEIDAERRTAELRATWNARLAAIRAARTPDERRLAMAFGGATERVGVRSTKEAIYRTATGETLQGTVVFDNQTGQAEVDGEPVTILKELPKVPPRPIGLNMAGPGGTINRAFLDPNNPGGPPVATVPTGMPIPPPPTQYSGTTVIPNASGVPTVYQLDPRRGGLGPELGPAPPPAGGLTPDQAEAVSWLTDVNTQIKAKTQALNPIKMPGMPVKALSAEQQNLIVQQVTRNRYKTLGELTAATKRQTGPPGPPGPQAGRTTPFDRQGASNLRRRLDAERGNVAPGSGLPK